MMAAGFFGLGSTLIKNVVTVSYHRLTHRLSILLALSFMRRLIQNFKIPPPRANTWHLTITCARGVGNLTRRAFPREGNLTFSRVGWGI